LVDLHDKEINWLSLYHKLVIFGEQNMEKRYVT